MLTKFNFYRTPKIEFGCGNIRKLPENIASFGKKTLIITGGKSFRSTPAFFCLIDELQNLKIKHYLHSASGEPSPGLVNSITDKYRNKRIKVVVGIGGGSVMDTAKAVSAMLLKNDNVENYLEGVGNKYHDGRKIPFIAVPTTSGTGSEATKNAVLSQVGESGYKKSLRHDNFIPNLALIDPELMISCPHSVSINCALDAFSQLIESFVSKEASPFTDSLVISAVKKIKKSFFAVIKNLENVEARSDMAYVALISGITLANAGLGTVHGFASSIGGFFDIPHGLICSRLLYKANKINIEKLLGNNSNEQALQKYVALGKVFTDKQGESKEYYCKAFDNFLMNLERELNISSLVDYGISEKNIEKIITKTGIKNNPVDLDKNDLRQILLSAI